LRERLLNLYLTLGAFPEVPDVLARLKRAGMRTAVLSNGSPQMLKAALLSPSFLYRAEEAKPVPGAYALSPYEIASRLSYFLWSTMPDEELFALAESRKLSDPEVIGQQVARMLKDEKAKALPLNFTTQWLQLEILRTNGPDPTRFPAFTPSLMNSPPAHSSACRIAAIWFARGARLPAS